MKRFPFLFWFVLLGFVLLTSPVLYGKSPSKQWVFPDDGADLQALIEKTREGGTIRIQRGTHRISRSLTIDKTIHFVGATGNMADVTLESDIDDDFVKITKGSATFRNISFKATGAEHTEYPLVRGAVCIDGGAPKFFRCGFVGQNNEGMLVRNSGNPQVVFCKIHDCGGAGIFVCEKGLGRFTACEVFGNTYAGIGVKTYGNPTVEKCTFRDGKQNGILVYDRGLGKFTGCRSFGNALSGIEVHTEGNPTVKTCTFRDNKSGGVHVLENGHGTFRNNTLSNNLYEGKVMNWLIGNNAGRVIRMGNRPNK